MKKNIMALVAVAMMATTAMAQNDSINKRQMRERKFDPTEMVKKRTEGTATKYGLDETQKAKLLELNTKYAKSMMGPRMHPRRPGGGMDRPQGRPERDSVNRQEPNEEMKAKMEERRKKMEEDMAAYNKELQNIMTADQYKSYQADMQKRMLRGPQNKEKKQ